MVTTLTVRAVLWLGALGAAALAAVLTPPYFNIAGRRRIDASSTCGVGVDRPELYCKLVGANQDAEHSDNLLIQGQVCDECDPTREDKSHPPESAVDGRENYWMSPPLSRGSEYNQVNLTISLGQEFHVAYILIKMGNSPRPGVWALERSADNGETYKPWQYFADTLLDCERYFGRQSLEPISRDDSVTCVTSYSKIVPLEGGEILINLLENRPSANDFFNSTILQEFTRATNVRLRLIRTKTLLGHLMSVARQDPTVTRRYFYSIKDISIGGRCRCNGHADLCDIPATDDPYKLLCRCQHDTCGHNCEMCCPNKVQKKWQQSKANKLFVCEECNCFGHTDQCVYNETVDEKSLSLDKHGNYDGGGVCQNCRHNTEGINCEKCIAGFYRPHGRLRNQTNVCEPCRCDGPLYTGNCNEGSGKCHCKTNYKSPDCDSCNYGYFDYPTCKPCVCNLDGTEGYYCEPVGGQCPCKSNFKGTYCDECSEGFYKFPECLDCNCSPIGSLADQCNVETGECECNSNYGGEKCDKCANGYYSFPSCIHCNCDVQGTENEICNKKTGECMCKEGFGGVRCDQCIPGYRGYPNCEPCGCSEVGSSSKVCDFTGKCRCLDNFAGRTCNMCIPGFYSYPDCLKCDCDPHGSIGVSCDNEGQCQCKELFTGKRCEKCKEGLFNFPLCEECNCHPAGVMENFPGCGNLSRVGELCQCKPRTQGRICDTCRPLYWNLQINNPDGCQDCECDKAGVMGGISVCDPKSGQCICKQFVTSRKCDLCANGMYNLQESNLFGCSDCGCDVGGSTNPICNKQTGECQCYTRITERDCSQPMKTYYFPTLHQELYEAEDAHTPDQTSVRYGFDSELFPDFSWKGYAVFSQIQNHIIEEIVISSSSLYRLILRYVNLQNETVGGQIQLKPDNPADEEQVSTILFKPSSKPIFAVASRGNTPAPLVLNPGKWEVHIINNKPIFLDYFVLMPQEYYEATLLLDRVTSPCKIGMKSLCRHFGYPSLREYDTVLGSGAFSDQNGFQEPIVNFFDDRQHLRALDLSPGSVALVGGETQPEVIFELPVKKPGNYVLLVNYVTSKEAEERKAEMRAEVGNLQDKQKAALHAVACPHSWPCRQVLTDKDGKVAIFDIDSDFLNIILKLEDKETIGVESIVAVPIEDWSLDFIRPRQVCAMKEGECLKANFLENDFKKVEVEIGNEEHVAKEPPRGIFDSSAGLVYIDPNNVLNIQGKVPTLGNYIIIVHFYQPDYPDFELQASVQNGKGYDAKLPVRHCPSNSGCRAVIEQVDGNNQFQFTKDFVLTLTGPKGRGVWLDYILIVPADKFGEKHLTEQPVDKTGLFIKECGQNHFFMNGSASDFCKKSVFSLTSFYNHGALACNCDNLGSLSYECEKFGGQCPCRPHVIGRRCNECRPGYYGFPNCKPCPCPALCHTETGSCECPPNVMGEQCDQCKPFTFGYHSIIGCEPCNCDPNGTKNNLQCNLFDGTCSCKENVMGRKCDSCSNGFYAFPDCEECDCDIRGTRDQICDKVTADCYCKEYVDGQACDVCKDGTFNIQEKNKQGCTKCFCFGKATRCIGSRLYRSKIIDLDGWTLSSVNINKTVTVEKLDAPVVKRDNGIEIDFSDDELLNKITYFSAPKSFLGNQLKAYGGNLDYSIHLSTGPFGAAYLSLPDMILEGPGMFLLHNSVEQPASNEIYPLSIELSEINFNLPSGHIVTREQFMQTLQDLKGIYIKTTYWEKSIRTRIEDISLDSASEIYTGAGGAALSVEQCYCPPNYKGLSCEECAPGYYRAQTGPFGGFCIPCQCHNHASTCDVNTGICHDCQNHTTGDHCEMCEVGYYGNATIGAPDDCMICACPLPFASNNFATDCEVSEDGERISCVCKPGYYGGRCEACSNGYYGNPEQPGETCQPCECSNNINPEEDGACDSLTGKCIRCLNNTYGDSCEYCAPGYFGDAITFKNCQSCICDLVGTERCDHVHGVCECKPNVQGEKCDRCALHHYGFESGKGCTPCDCGLASDSLQCEGDTGQCRCRHGVTGLRCDRCASGYWNYNAEGCTLCACNSEYSIGISCNPESGHCECLQGVIGERCDHCPHRWVLEQGRGCFECDHCIHDLLDAIDNLTITFQPVTQNFESLEATHLMSQKLMYINETASQLQPNVTQLAAMKVDMEPINTVFEELRENTSKLERTTEFSLNKLKEALDGKVNDKTKEMEEFVNKAVQLAMQTVQEVINIADSFEKGGGFGVSISEFEAKLAEAKQILQELEEKQPEYDAEEVKGGQLARARECLSKMQNFKQPLDDQAKKISALKGNISEIDRRLEDLRQHTNDAEQQAFELDKKNRKNKEADVEGKHELIAKKNDEALDLMKTNDKLLEAIVQTLTDSGISQGNLTSIKYEMDDLMGRIKARMSDSFSSRDDVNRMVEEAIAKAHDLDGQANDLVKLSKESQYDSNAIDAVNANKKIVEIMRDALMIADEARSTAQNASELSEGLDDEAGTSWRRSQGLYQEAEDLYNEATGDLGPKLENAKEKVLSVQKLNQENAKEIDTVENFLSNPPVAVINDKVLELAGNADKEAGEVEDMLEDILPKLEEDQVLGEQLHNNSENARIAIEQANKQLNQVSNILPNITKLAESLRNRPEGLTDDIKTSLEELRKKIRIARETADRVKLGIKFYRNSSLQLRHTDHLPDQGINSRISLYFNTSEPRGLLYFLGNEKAVARRYRRTISTGDFMALEVESGYLKFTADLGSGATSISIDDRKVDDDLWYHSEIKRTGKIVNVYLEWEKGNSSKTGIIEGNSTILNLDKDSKLYLGGFPTTFSAPDEILSSSFKGSIDELSIGNIDVGLWNFIEAANIYPNRERNQLENTITSTGFRFQGDSFVEVSNIYRIESRTAIYLHFKTFAKEGLIFLSVNNKEFLSLELREGTVFFQFDLGGGIVTMRSEKEFNDGMWHNLEATRVNNKGALKVDGELSQQEVGVTSHSKLKVSKGLFIGGYPELHNLDYVTNTNFDGCIDQVSINSANVDLTSNVRALGVTPGCPPKVASVVSFEKGRRGYVKWKDLSLLSEGLQLILRFRTPSPHGILAFVSNGAASASLSLVDGQIVFESGSARVKSESTLPYNDSQWHVIMATLDTVSLKLFIDDYESYSSMEPPQPMRLLNIDLYFGGVPSEVSAAASYSQPFYGCIGDATVNDVIVNFGNLTQNDTIGAHVGKCVLDSAIVRIAKPLPPMRPRPPPLIEEEEPLRPPVRLPRPTDPTPPVEEEVEAIPTRAPASREPDRIEGCALPLYPQDNAQVSKVGYRFGTKYGSRLEYDRLLGGYKSRYEFTIEIKTINNNVKNGIIFYAASAKYIDMIVLFLKDGELNYALDNGSGPVIITSLYPINDGEWHTVTFKKKDEKGTLVVDGKKAGEGNTPGSPKALNVDPPYYLGGINPKMDNTKDVLQDVPNTFEGCIKGLSMNGDKLKPKASIDVVPCSESEDGVFFSANGGGFIKQYEKFVVGVKLQVEMDIKPRNPSGILLSVHGKKHYLVLELVEGTIRFVIGDGSEETISTFQPTPINILCDGEWHHIAAYKSRHVLTLGLDGSYTAPIFNSSFPIKTNTNHNLFIGGHKAPYKNLRGVTTTQNYVGCIRNLLLNGKEETFVSQNVYGNVTYGYCPMT